METPLTILYTYGLQGKLALLPRLYTFLRRLRAAHAADARVLTLDLGESCAPEVFPCALTGGRSSLIVLDAMGYDAANVDGWLSEVDRDRLAHSHLRMALVDTTRPFMCDTVEVSVIGTGSNPALARFTMTHTASLRVLIQPAQLTVLEGRTLRLTAVGAGQVGMARITWNDRTPYLAARDVFSLPGDTLPDPTIAATVEFVLSEARFVQRKRVE